MAETFKVLAQVLPLAGVLTDGYVAPFTTTISSIVVANQGVNSAKIRISVAVAGALDTPSQYLYYDTPLSGNKTFAATLGITIAATDVVRVYDDTGAVSFNIFGVQLT